MVSVLRGIPVGTFNHITADNDYNRIGTSQQFCFQGQVTYLASHKRYPGSASVIRLAVKRLAVRSSAFLERVLISTCLLFGDLDA